MPSPFHVQQAVKHLHCGDVIAYPTEAVWGLGCDPFNRQAVAKILEIKQRSISKGLILVAASLEQFAPYLSAISPQQEQLLKTVWPVAVSWLVPDNGYAPAWIRGDHSGLAIRVSSHPTVAALCQLFAGPIVSTSANPKGQEPARTALQVQRYFGSQVDLIVPGKLGDQKNPSEIRDLLTQQVIRSA